MLKKLTILIFLSIIGNSVSAQDSNVKTDTFYVNVFISAEKTVYVETEKTQYENVKNKVSELVRNKPFKIDQKIVYRICADENLDLGFIIDVNQKMLSAYNDNVITERYLLNTIDLKIDGQNWFESINLKDLKN